MITTATKEQWDKAQKLEYEYHLNDVRNFDDAYARYFDSYRQLFGLVGLSFALHGKSVVEIGAGPYPALSYCKQHAYSYIVDPLYYDSYYVMLQGSLCYSKSLYMSMMYNEAWIFNCLQQVQDPDYIINWAKIHCAAVRFFEPIDLPVNDIHLHSFDLDYFKDRFGGVNLYEPKEYVKNFHSVKCAYGVWTKNN